MQVWRPCGAVFTRRVFGQLATFFSILFVIAPIAASANPYLRLDVLPHSGVITDLDIDHSERFFVTGSADKTVRLWAAPNAEAEFLAQPLTIRPPIGPGEQGAVYGAAISPGADMVAIGGYFGEKGAYNVLIYEITSDLRHSGDAPQKHVATLGPFAEPAEALRFSPDGRHLAIGLRDAGGLTIWETGDWREIWTDRDYQRTIQTLDYSNSNALVVGGDDGFLRLYDRTRSGAYKQIAKRQAFDPQPASKACNRFFPPSAFTSGGERIFELRGAAFSPNGRHIAVGAYVCDVIGFQRIGVFKANGQLTPVDVRSNDDNQKLPRSARAISADVSGEEVRRLREQRVPYGDIQTLAWRRNGASLVASGYLRAVTGKCGTERCVESYIREYTLSDGRFVPAHDDVMFTDTPLSHDGATEILALSDGRVLFATNRTEVGILSPELKLQASMRSNSVRARAGPEQRAANRSGMLVNENGTIIAWPVDYYSGKHYVFDANRRSMRVEEKAPEGLRKTLIENPAVQVAGWFLDKDIPQVWSSETNGAFRPLSTLEDGERPRALAFERNGENFVLGTTRNIRKFDAAGEELYRRDEPAAVVHITTTEAGSGADKAEPLIITISSNGSARWRRQDTGEVVLSLAAFADVIGAVNWIVWTPDGHYDGSASVDDRVIWHLNPDKKDESAEGFPVTAATFANDGGPRRNARIHNLASRVLAGGEVFEQAATPQQIRAAAPPSVQILNVRERGAKGVEIEYRLETPPGVDEDDVRVILDNQSLGAAIELKEASVSLLGGAKSIFNLTNNPEQAPFVVVNYSTDVDSEGEKGKTRTVIIPDENLARAIAACKRVQVRAEADGRVGDITYYSPYNETNCSGYVQEKLPIRALVVGVTEYAANGRGIDNLEAASEDAAKFASMLRAQAATEVYDNAGEIIELLDKHATHENIAKSLNRLIARANESPGVNFLFFAGHGVRNAANSGAFMFLPHDADISDSLSLLNSGISGWYLAAQLRQLTTNGNKTYVFLDVCNSGGISDPRFQLFDTDGFGSDVKSHGVYVLTASDSGNLAVELPTGGYFTDAMLDGIESPADLLPKDDAINFIELYTYIGTEVSLRTGGYQRVQANQSNINLEAAIHEKIFGLVKKADYLTPAAGHDGAASAVGGD